MIAFSCHHCGKHYTLKPEFAGRTTSCSTCHTPLVVPSPPSASIASAPIAFACIKCGMKFSVKAEFAGRSTQCPTCKEPLVVPSPDATMAHEPALGRIQGTASSLAEAGVEGGVTLAGDFATAEALSLQNLIDGKANDGARYVVESELARGGMGAVMRAVDCDIRREVAIKYLLDQRDPQKKLRFVEEAQITGQLEHPNIVPIHELGVDADKRVFFSMKMGRGRSLAEILKALHNEPAKAEKEFSQGKLLNIFVNICNALAYAHARGVVHRDLKPANIMVGGFGEVYVMDWGLAKVLNKGMAATATGPVMAIPVARLVGQAALPVPGNAADRQGCLSYDGDPFDFAPVPLATPVAPSETAASSGSGKVVTSRESDADLTQDGAVLGTPVYMPPEQASGKIHEIDERSDVYSMGAILYEILTLHAPISKEGGYWPILLRVTQGQIEPPDKKAPDRARAGKVPPELAAVAMKALAKHKEDRYRSIELLRTDIERFMEGRSVSAKEDTVREACIKLVKRNQGVSIATAAAAAVLAVVGIWSLVAVLNANARARAEELARRDQAKKSVPSLVRAARMLINENQLDDAFTQVDTAVGFDDAAVDPRFLRAQLRCGRAEYAAAITDLERCVSTMPDRAECSKLLDVVKKTRPDNTDTVLALANELTRQKAFAAGAQVARNAEKLVGSRRQLLAHYQGRIDTAWPGLGKQLTCEITTGQFCLGFDGHRDVRDISPLRGIPLGSLELNQCINLDDLTPLKGMPLISLSLDRCAKLEDLTPLQGMPIKHLNLAGCDKITDLTVLKAMPLITLNLTGLNVAHLSPLSGLRLNELLLTHNHELTDLTALKDMPLTILDEWHCQCFSPLPARTPNAGTHPC